MSPEVKRTFSQEDLNGFLAKERKRWEVEREALQKQISEYQIVVDAAKTRVAELEQQTAELSSSRDAAVRDFESVSAEHTQTVTAMEARYSELVTAYRRTEADSAIERALAAANGVPEAARIATAEMQRASKIEQSETGAVIAVTYDGERYVDITQAAKRFLENHPFFAKARPGGSGHPGGLSSMPRITHDITKADPAQLAAEGWSEAIR